MCVYSSKRDELSPESFPHNIAAQTSVECGIQAPPYMSLLVKGMVGGVRRRREGWYAFCII